MSRGAIVAARWLHEPQPIGTSPVRCGLPHRAGWCRPGGAPFSSPCCWSCRGYGRISDPGMGPYPPQGALALDTNTSQSAIGWWAGVSTPCGAVSTRWKSVFVPELSELYMHGRVSDPGMGSCLPRRALALCTSPIQSTIGRWGRSFHTVWSGFNPDDHRSRPQVIEVVKVWNGI